MVTRSKKDNNRKQKAKIGNPRLMCSQNWFLEFENMKSLWKRFTEFENNVEILEKTL